VVAGSTIVNRTMNGMETPVLLLGLSALAWALARYLADPEQGRAIVLGLATGAVVLARLDFLTVVWLIPVAVGVRSRRLREVAGTVSGLAVLVVPWFAWSWWTFGHALPVSGEVKLRYVNDAIKAAYGSRWSTAFAGHTIDNLKPVAPNIRYQLSPRPGATVEIATGVVLSIGCFAWCRQHARSGADRRRSRFTGSPEWWAILIVGALVALQFVVALISLPGQWLYIWYADALYATAAVAGGLGLGLVAAALGRSQPGRRRLAPALGLALVTVLGVDHRAPPLGRPPLRRHPLSRARWRHQHPVRQRRSRRLAPPRAPPGPHRRLRQRLAVVLARPHTGREPRTPGQQLPLLRPPAEQEARAVRRLPGRTAPLLGHVGRPRPGREPEVGEADLECRGARRDSHYVFATDEGGQLGFEQRALGARGKPAAAQHPRDRRDIVGRDIRGREQHWLYRGGVAGAGTCPLGSPPKPSRYRFAPATCSARCERRALVGHWAHGEHCRRCIVHGDAFFKKLTKFLPRL